MLGGWDPVVPGGGSLGGGHSDNAFMPLLCQVLAVQSQHPYLIDLQAKRRDLTGFDGIEG